MYVEEELGLLESGRDVLRCENFDFVSFSDVD
jgi:hypothetical protein